MDRDGELHARDPSRSRARRADRRPRRAHRQGAASRTAISTASSIRREPAKRWTNLRDWHELYCARPPDRGGGRPRAGDRQDHPARHRAPLCRSTSRRCSGPAEGQRRGYCGHPEIELALVKLYRLTGERRYLDLARFFIDERGRQPHYFDQEAVARGDDPARLLVRDLRIQPVARAGARAGSRRRTRRARHVSLLRHGRSRRRVRRREPDGGLPARCGPTSRQAALRHRRPRALGDATRASPPTTICRTRPPMRRPAPRSG